MGFQALYWPNGMVPVLIYKNGPESLMHKNNK